MAITPADAIALNADDIILLNKLEEAIDVELRLQYKSGHTIVIRHALLQDLFSANIRVMNELIATYNEKGWNIIRYENSKQGPWLSFSEIESRGSE